MLSRRQKLPAYALKDKICETVDNNQVLLICGETGCGKSTQLPQFILDHAIDSDAGAACNIICTQPRRISATALASRVADERCEKV
jgi:HrpA-like RNA helicase